jgi:hypothetical protein
MCKSIDQIVFRNDKKEKYLYLPIPFKYHKNIEFGYSNL